MDKRFEFRDDTFLVGDIVIQLGADFRYDAWKDTHSGFLMFKTRPLIEAFDRFFSSQQGFHPRNILEIGIWDGGSAALWFEYFEPDKLVAIDKLDREDGAYFRQYVEERGIQERLKTYWGIDQGESTTLREIVAREFSGQLDLVIDDGSHLLGPTRTSVETLLPLMSVGGIYVIEDWNWELMPEFRRPDHPWVGEEGLVGLAADLSKVVGSSNLIEAVTVRRNFVAIERGPGALDPQGLDLDAYVGALPGRAAPV